MFGAALLLASNLIARTLPPQELPIGIVTHFVGALRHRFIAIQSGIAAPTATR